MRKLKDWEMFETEIADAIDGHRQRGSGNGPIQKGDVRAEDFLIECKYTSGREYVLNYKTWEKICEEARNLALIPLFACRSQAGDFILMNQFDYCDLDLSHIIEQNPDNGFKNIGVTKNVHMSCPLKATIEGARTNYDVIAFNAVIDD